MMSASSIGGKVEDGITVGDGVGGPKAPTDDRQSGGGARIGSGPGGFGDDVRSCGTGAWGSSAAVSSLLCLSPRLMLILPSVSVPGMLPRSFGVA